MLCLLSIWFLAACLRFGLLAVTNNGLSLVSGSNRSCLVVGRFSFDGVSLSLKVLELGFLHEK